MVAYSLETMAIGREGRLPWAGKLPADMDHFRELTTGKTVIMGRTTYESIDERHRPLRNRQNIVLTMSDIAIEGVQVAHSLDEAYELAEAESLVIGGAKVYEQALPTIDRVYATEIVTRVPGADAFFLPLLVSEWKVDGKREFHNRDELNRFLYSFVTYLRRDPILDEIIAKVDEPDGPTSRELFHSPKAGSIGGGAHRTPHPTVRPPRLPE